MRAALSAIGGESVAPACGCRENPFEKTRGTLAEGHLRAAVRDALATDRLRATDEIAVFGTHPYTRSSGLARGFPDSHAWKEVSPPSWALAPLLDDPRKRPRGRHRLLQPLVRDAGTVEG
jgi:hypothetical protein